MQAYVIEYFYSSGYDRNIHGVVVGTEESTSAVVDALNAKIIKASFSVDRFVSSWRKELEGRGVPTEVTLTLRPPENMVEKARQEAHKNALTREYYEASEAEILGGVTALTG